MERTAVPENMDSLCDMIPMNSKWTKEETKNGGRHHTIKKNKPFFRRFHFLCFS